jgi:hypothetical protein
MVNPLIALLVAKITLNRMEGIRFKDSQFVHMVNLKVYLFATVVDSTIKTESKK